MRSLHQFRKRSNLGPKHCMPLHQCTCKAALILQVQLQLTSDNLGLTASLVVRLIGFASQKKEFIMPEIKWLSLLCR